MIVKTHTNLLDHRRAVYSDCELYRYLLEIIWDPEKRPVMFIGLNPSTATELQNDPTVTRCERYARAWGAGGLLMTNLFGARETNPREMMKWALPIGLGNSIPFLRKQAKRSQKVIAAWGNHGSWMQRDEDVSEALKLDCLRITKLGCPEHPLYLPSDLIPIPFNYRNS